MSNISTWSTTAASNNSAAPDGFPEGQTPSSLNDCSRELMAAVRVQHEDAQWIDLGDTTTYASATTFTVAGDVTAQYDVGRRIRATDSTTLYGAITDSNYSNPNTTVTVVLDAGSLSASLTAVSLGIISGTNNASNFTDADHTKLDGLSTLTVLDTPEILLTNSGLRNVWTTHASTTLSTAGATKAILRFRVNDTDASPLAEAFLRKTGTALAKGQTTMVGRGAAVTLTEVIVNLDGSSQFDWYSTGVSATIFTYITLVGYYS